MCGIIGVVRGRTTRQPPDLADLITTLWLETPFEGGRHQRRIDQITEVDRRGER